MHELLHEYTNRKVSPWGGIKFFQQTYERSGVRADLLAAPLPEGGSNRAYEAIDLIEGFMVATVLGSRRIAHTGMLRTDEVIREIFGWKRGMASQSTFSRFFRKFDLPYNDVLFTSLMRKFWSRIGLQKMTIDVDSTVISRYGRQEGAEVGYNPAKPGRPSHHPLMAFCEELKMAVNGWMREGNTHDSNGMDCFIDQLLEIVPAGRIGLLRGDSGFYSDGVMFELEDKGINYIIRARMTKRLLGTVLRQANWHKNDTVFPDAEYAEFLYQGSDWLQARRAIAVRRPKARAEGAGQALLFEEDRLNGHYDFTVYITSTDLPGSKVHLLYNQRADCENRIKELKYDYGLDGFAFESMGATEAAFRFVLLAYNIMALFKEKVMTGPVRHQLSTIRFQCIAIGSYLVKGGRKKVMKLSAEGRRRHFLQHFFDKTELLEPPFQFSNA